MPYLLASIGKVHFLVNSVHKVQLSCTVMCSLVYFISAVASPVCGFGIDRLGRNIFWLLIGVIVTMACHGLLAFTFLTPFVSMVCKTSKFFYHIYTLVVFVGWPVCCCMICEH